MDFIFCRINYLFLFADSLWPPIISTSATAYSSLHLVFKRMFSLSLYCLPFPLFLSTALILFLFFPLKTQIPLCYHLRLEFFGTFAIKSCKSTQLSFLISPYSFNPSKPELNPICYLLALLGAHHFLHVSRIRVKLLTLRRLMSYIYGAPILDVSRSHTTTQHSR